MNCLKRFSKFIIFSIIFSYIYAPIFAESFRVKKVHIINASNDITNCTETARIGINESLGIYLPEDKTFFEGLEIKFEIPDSLAAYRDSVACTLYSSISPSPAAEKIDYSGTRGFVQTLPGKLSWILQIPFIEKNSLKANSYTTIADSIPDISSNVVFLRLQPVMKGIPEEVSSSLITVTVKPLFIKKGKLNINLISENDETKNCSIFIDDEAVNYSKKNGILLDTGIHNISVISEFYRNEVRTVRIDQAKKTELDIQLKSVDPTLILTAPDGTEVFLDEEKFTHFGEEILISEGEHKIRLILGDYEVTKKVTIVKGKTYTINLSVDLQINEE